MLELAKILRDIDDFGRERAESFSGLLTELAVADGVEARIREDLAGARAEIDRAKTSWLTAGFEEDPSKVYPLPMLQKPHAVLASDGSQILADKHEVALCYLINSSCVTLFYGTGERPVAATHPRLCYKDSDLSETYNNQEVRVNDKMVGIRRTLAEANELERGMEMVAKKGIPAVALWDGSLILWSLQNEPTDYKMKALNEYKRAFDVARELQIPIAGYVSDPGSRDFVNSMKILLCDESPVNCDNCGHKKNAEALPCDAIAHLKDSMVYGARLGEGERSVLFTSKSRILDDYGDHRIVAFYLNTGKEIARVEVPQWVAANPLLLDLTHAVCVDQAAKGRGYPVALSEAHEQAVVRGADRTAFYEAVERSFIKHGAAITRSMKRISKGY